MQWVPEVKHFCPGVPFVLVGCKKDLREHQETINELKKMNQKPVTEAEARAIADKIEAYAYIECSAKSKTNIREVMWWPTKRCITLIS